LAEQSGELDRAKRRARQVTRTFGSHVMKQILIIVTCIILSGCAAHYDERLLGSWKSDREGTVAEFDRRFPGRFKGKPEKKERFSKIFGDLTHTFTPHEMTVEYDDCVSTARYKILKIEGDSVLIKIYGDFKDKLKIRFSDNHNSYWVNEETDFSEKFTKIGTEPVASPESQGGARVQD
jgi:hypothetical protein